VRAARERGIENADAALGGLVRDPFRSCRVRGRVLNEGSSGFMRASAPLGPKQTARTCSSVCTTMNTASAARTVADSESAQVSPSISVASRAPVRRTRAVTS